MTTSVGMVPGYIARPYRRFLRISGPLGISLRCTLLLYHDGKPQSDRASPPLFHEQLMYAVDVPFNWRVGDAGARVKGG